MGIFKEHQTIIYGAPGTGKSFFIKQKLELGKIDESNVFRTTFHSDLSYSDFVGYLKPCNDSDGSIDYKFQAGPFTFALERALSSSNDVYLVIEELNRGNAPSILGDIFQLLDRGSDGKSSYFIKNTDVRAFLDNNEACKKTLESLGAQEGDILLPSNFFIIATMNTADQNVFVLDTAFKRRFVMRYIPIVFDETIPAFKALNEMSKISVFDNKHTWGEFAQLINKKVDGTNANGLVVSEDKKLGPFFVSESDVSSKQSFCDKVIYYLKNDVFKYDSNFLNESYESIYKRFVLENDDLFDILNLGV